MSDADALALSGSSWSFNRELMAAVASSSAAKYSKIHLTGLDLDVTLSAKILEIIQKSGKTIKEIRFIDCAGHVAIVTTLALATTSLESLCITFGSISTSAFTPIAHSIGIGLRNTNLKLKNLELKSGNHNTFTMSDLDANSLADGMSGNNTLECFQVVGCQLEVPGAIQALARGMGRLGRLKNVRFESCFTQNGHPLDDSSIADLFRGRLHLLECIHLTRNKCHHQAITMLSEILDRTHLRQIILSSQCIDQNQSIDLSRLVGALGRTGSLQTLELKCNKLSSDRDMAYLAAALMHNTSIKYIGLANNKITNVGLEIFSSRVPSMVALKHLAIQNNTFDDRGAMFLAKAMESNFSISRVDCDRTIQCYRTIRYYADLNWSGRRYDTSLCTMNASIWPFMLGRVATLKEDHLSTSRERQADVLYFILRTRLPHVSNESQARRAKKQDVPSYYSSSKKTVRKKKLANRARHRLMSIFLDSRCIADFKQTTWPPWIQKLPLVANQRCGQWYCKNTTASCHFKSTDGHVNVWQLSLKRLNLALLHDVVSHSGGCVIVDSSTTKLLPDSFSRTIPIWATVLNRVVVRYANELGMKSVCYNSWDTHLYTPERLVSMEEHRKIIDLISDREETLYQSRAIVDPEGLVRSLTKPLRVVWMDSDGELYRSNGESVFGHRTNFSADEAFFIVCWNPSRYQNTEKGVKNRHIKWTEQPGFFYSPGAANDHEGWARHLTPSLFWENHQTLLAPTMNDDQVEQLIDEIVLRSNIELVSGDIAEKNFQKNQISTYCDRIGHLNLWIGSRRAGRSPFCWETFDAILNIIPEKNLVHDTLPGGKFYLQLPVEEGKRDKVELEKWMPVGLSFLVCHMQKDRRILVHCSQGKDRSVAVSLVFVCIACPLVYPLEMKANFFSWDLNVLIYHLMSNQIDDSVETSNVHLMSGLPRVLVSNLLRKDGKEKFLIWLHSQLRRNQIDGPLVDKENIRIALHLIRQDRDVADPTRSTMQKINRFLMSSVLYQACREQKFSSNSEEADEDWKS